MYRKLGSAYGRGYRRRESTELDLDRLGERLCDSLRPRLRDGTFLRLPLDESDEYELEPEEDVPESESDPEDESESESESEEESLSDADRL